jgi:LysM repeat protein
MESPEQSSNARFAAIIALVAAFVIVIVMIGTSLGGGSDAGSSQSSAQRSAKSKKAARAQRKVYVVKPGDCCLSQIAQKTGIDIEVLEQFNPKIDPQAIHSGDRVKLR